MTEPTRRRNRQGDASRRRILEAALGIAAESGYRAATIARITEETGLPASSIFWHFKNKQVLLAEALEHSYQGRRAEVPEWVQTGSPETLEARLVENLTFGARVPRQSDYWRLGLTVALEGPDVDPQLSGRFVEIRGYSRGRMVDWWGRELGVELHTSESGYLGDLTLAFLDGRFLNQALSGAFPRRMTRMFAHGLALAAREGVAPGSAQVPALGAPSLPAPSRSARSGQAEPPSSRETLLRAAEKVMAARGFEGATIAKICKEAGLPASSLYWQFKDKDDLLAEVMKAGGESWLAAVEGRPYQLGLGWKDALEERLGWMLADAESNPAPLRIGHLLALQHSGGGEAGRRAFKEIRAERSRRVARWFVEATDPGLDARQARQLADLLQVLADGLFISVQLEDRNRPLASHAAAMAAIARGAVEYLHTEKAAIAS
ncbi:hypothetical protein GCM10023081_23770 [Arthrobacter ginkgonis]|uniref:HTH tetR-type domain-containing protein n=1 Tax=Arthrobacter ginkgonis TaxID=1630594 RepID=A0ABP7CE13_9MICC